MTVLGSTFNKLKSCGTDVGLVYCIKAQSGCAEKQKTFFFFRDLPWACLPLNQNTNITETLLFILTQTTNLSSVPGTTHANLGVEYIQN